MNQEVRFGSLRIMRTDPEATLPTRAHPDDAGLDIYALEDAILKPGSGVALRTGMALGLPLGFVGLIADRSSMAKKGFKTAGGVIDAGYRGEVRVVLWNLTPQELGIKRGERIAQLLVIPIATPAVDEVSSLDDTARGAKGFGSTGN